MIISQRLALHGMGHVIGRKDVIHHLNSVRVEADKHSVYDTNVRQARVSWRMESDVNKRTSFVICYASKVSAYNDHILYH